MCINGRDGVGRGKKISKINQKIMDLTCTEKSGSCQGRKSDVNSPGTEHK